MSNAVRSTSGAQGGGLAVGGGSSASRATPAGGASFGGVLGQAMAGPAHPSTGAGDGKADGTSDGKDSGKGRGNPVTAADAAATVAADLAPAVTGLPATNGTAATAGKDSAPGATGGSDKKRRTDAAAANPVQSVQAAAMVAASLAAPAAMGAAMPTPTLANAGADATVGAATAVTNATTGAPGARAAAGSINAKSAATFVKGANALNNHELVEPEDGTGSQEPDGFGPATATVGRPAAMNSGAASALSSGVGPATTANAAASGTMGRQLGITAVTDTASSANAPASTVVLPTLATAGSDPSQASLNGGAPAPAGTTGTGDQTMTPGVMAANLAPLAMPSNQTVPAAVNGPVNVAAPNGTSQTLANALGTQLLSMVAAGRNQVTVHLSPPDLGTLTVHVEVQSHDVSAWFASPQPQVQQAVNDALTQLHGSLSGAGLNLAGAWVGADVSGGGNGRPAATPLPIRRAPAAPGRADANVAGATSVEGLSVYA